MNLSFKEKMMDKETLDTVYGVIDHFDKAIKSDPGISPEAAFNAESVLKAIKETLKKMQEIDIKHQGEK